MSDIYLEKGIKPIDFEDQLQTIKKPDFRVVFTVMPSWNDYMGMSRRPMVASGLVKTWRKKGFQKAIEAARLLNLPIQEWIEHGLSEKGNPIQIKHQTIKPVLLERASLIVRYWRPTWNVYDSFSPMIKPIVDGFVDAGVIAKDNFQFIPDYSVQFMGVDTSLQLSAIATAERKTIKQFQKKSLLTPARYWCDFYSV